MTDDDRHPSPAAGTALSEREEWVARLLAHGHTNKEVARRLAVSCKTVETFKARAMKKLGVRTRVQLVRYAVCRGWLAPNSPDWA